MPCIWGGTRDDITRWIRTVFRNTQMSVKGTSIPLASVALGRVPNSSENQLCHLHGKGNNINIADGKVNTIR